MKKCQTCHSKDTKEDIKHGPQSRFRMLVFMNFYFRQSFTVDAYSGLVFKTRPTTESYCTILQHFRRRYVLWKGIQALYYGQQTRPELHQWCTGRFEEVVMLHNREHRLKQKVQGWKSTIVCDTKLYIVKKTVRKNRLFRTKSFICTLIKKSC